MAKIRFYSDAHISKAVIQGLRARGRTTEAAEFRR